MIFCSDLLRKTNSLETFLLCSAALANLTSLLPSCLVVFASSGILAVLLAHRAAASSSVYIQDQVVTVLANLAKLGAARTQMLQASGLQLLVDILGTTGGRSVSRNTSLRRPDAALAAATERTVSKAAIALARLCLDPSSADAVIRIGGLDQLVGLAGDQESSDTVRIASLAAIKTITIYCSAKVNLDLGGGGHYNTVSSLESFV